MTRTRLSRYLVQAAGTLALAMTVAAGAQAAEVKKLAIMVPEQGTDYGWNQQGVDAAWLGVVQLIPAFNHPVRVAERAAALDILSNGRLEFGAGRSTRWPA